MDRRRAWAPQGRGETGRGQFPVVAGSRAREGARASITTPPDSHRVRAASNTEAVLPTSSGGSRPATGHDIASEPVDGPTSYESPCKRIERMPRSIAVPKSQVSLRELSELS